MVKLSTLFVRLLFKRIAALPFASPKYLTDRRSNRPVDARWPRRGTHTPGNSDPSMADSAQDESPPRIRARSRGTARDALLAGIPQALLAGFADEAAHGIVEFVAWLYEQVITGL
ncbi:hypothetical protein AS594_39940 [Streptomyces agglomeratus]|uniref:Uncharacterized protein n=1 Tax=Streptomyces agglomeratus TaxID=285458 RepID=A0A1E5NZI5_9ACTN|nr:hypothetical protein [Streptomyces agglomeratus]OEJ21679.1 hypothetical protein AS594_39940 [Streptomyces agglomeratus]